jgi:sterol desaturase/sphingolipid hydroxylase (fatty acid hydroxylase superfamily)
MDESKDKGIVGQIVVVSIVLLALAAGLLWMGVNGMLPTAAGLGSGLDPNLRTFVIIAILALIAAGAWFVLPKGKRG